ncbi:MAG: hypothetical protein ACKO96_28235, partial [Flammeovirgaceae bacterium]
MNIGPISTPPSDRGTRGLERGIEPDPQARIRSGPNGRENLEALSEPTEPMSGDDNINTIIITSIEAKLGDREFIPEAKWGTKKAFARLIRGIETFSPELIRGIAELESTSEEKIIGQFLRLQYALKKHVEGDEFR